MVEVEPELSNRDDPGIRLKLPFKRLDLLSPFFAYRCWMQTGREVNRFPVREAAPPFVQIFWNDSYVNNRGTRRACRTFEHLLRIHAF